MGARSRILNVRVYPGDWIVCDIVREGDAGSSRTVRHGKAIAKGPDEMNWLDWLFDAPDAVRRDFVVAADGSSVEWPKLHRTVSADEFIERSGNDGIQHDWLRRSLREKVCSEELVGRWQDIEKAELIDLHPHGGCGKKMLARGRPGTVSGTLVSNLEEGTRIQIEHQLAKPMLVSETALAILVEQGLVDPSRVPADRQVTSHRFEYEIMRFDGVALELLETADNGLRVLGPSPIWWIKSKRHLDRKTRVQV